MSCEGQPKVSAAGMLLFDPESCAMGDRGGPWAGERVMRMGDAISTNAQPDKVDALSFS
jgi:hypothetical protein